MSIKNTIFKTAVIAVILAAGWFAVFNMPKTVESFLPVVRTVELTPAEYTRTVSGVGVISQDAENSWFVTVSVGESDINKVEAGQSASLSGAAFDDGIYTATVRDIADVAVRRQGEYALETVVEVTLRIDNPDDKLRPGYSARAEIKTAPARTVFILPYSVILQDNAGEYVYLLSGNKAVRQDILTGIELSDGAEVILGLSEDDQIIANPDRVSDNALVTPVREGD